MAIPADPQNAGRVLPARGQVCGGRARWMRLALPGDQMGRGEWRYHSSLNSTAGHAAEGLFGPALVRAKTWPPWWLVVCSDGS